MLTRRSGKGLLMAGLAATAALSIATSAQAGVMFGPVTPSVTGGFGSTIQVPFQVTLTGGTSQIDLSYVAFNFATTDPAVASIVGWNWDPGLGGSAGPVTFSHFWSPAVLCSSPTLLMGSLTLQLGNIPGSATISVTQGDAGNPAWLWQGQNCPTNPDMAPLTVTVPEPASLAALGLFGLAAGRRRR